MTAGRDASLLRGHDCARALEPVPLCQGQPFACVTVLHYVPPGVLTEGYLQPSQQGCRGALSRALLSGLAPVTGSSAAANKGIHHDGQEP
ncbi:hypothetical protein Q8A67_002454 [Cirrhinus molitorella]|uniref:Uncharacterized protein n=1 Tax=Cirrhinus molitorella TaxID=172907 RepID=A0AA88QCT8_9TELE|nr:hypothetical protein Q8A67_002454 [Cirrhinus molitorella]